MYYLRVNINHFKEPHYIMRIAVDRDKNVFDYWINVKHKSTLKFKRESNALEAKRKILLRFPKLKIEIEKIKE